MPIFCWEVIDIINKVIYNKVEKIVTIDIRDIVCYSNIKMCQKVDRNQNFILRDDIMDLFISYTTRDLEIAKRVYTALQNDGYTVWFAPREIAPGANYATEIGDALVKDKFSEENIMENIENIEQARAFILILSGSAMRSPWVSREIKMAIDEGIPIFVLKIDNVPWTSEFKFMLIQTQIIEAYHLKTEHITKLKDELKNIGVIPQKSASAPLFKENVMIDRESMGIRLIAQGDPYYISGETLRTSLTKYRFFIAPPKDLLGLAEEEIQWINSHLNNPPELFDMSWDDVFSNIPIPDLKERIDNSRKKVMMQFVRHENGCYFNNLKFGIYSINSFERTEDLSERPVLSIRFFTTDYYTHRVMKDVCKQLVKENNPYLTSELNLFDMTYSRIFFTSLGINLILLEDELRPDRKLILTERSVNAAESSAYKNKKISVSVIEGVSNSDYDPYTGNVDLVAAAFRGLQEELGVDDHQLQRDKLRFYDFFLNKENLEMGISCSIEIKSNLTIHDDILTHHGKDEQLELSDKKELLFSDLRDYAVTNAESFMPQALYTVCSFLDATGNFIIRRFNKTITHKEKFIMGKNGTDTFCGDAIVDTDDFIAVIDGATPKGERLWEGMRGDVYISMIISNAIKKLDRNICAQDAIEAINHAVFEAYEQNGVKFESLATEETLQASVIIYSAARHEVWNFGDCLLRINNRDYNNIKKLDNLMSDFRTFMIEAEMIKGNYHYDPNGSDYGRECILPYLKMQGIFANTDYYFGYDVINGGKIHAEHVKVYAVQSGDRVVLSSDGYPKLFDTLEESEHYLEVSLKEDPDCIYALKGTKGMRSGNISYDDRSYIGFTVDEKHNV